LGTPLARMHLAKASGPLAPEAVELCPEAVVEADAGAPPAVAALGLEELPPQPHTSAPPTTAATASRHARGDRVSRLGWIASRI
jgi:hypothetical protein